MRLKKVMVGAVTAALVATGLSLSAPLMASAHTGDLDVTAVCNTQTGQYDLTATLKIEQTGYSGSTMWKVGTESFTGTPSSANGMDRGPVASTGSQTIVLGTFSVPGTTTSKGPWVYAHTTWSDQYKKGSDGQLLENLAGTCKIPDAQDAKFDVGIVPATCESGAKLEYSEGNFSNATVTAGSTPSGTVGPASYSVSATATAGHVFVEDQTNPITGTLDGPLNANAPPCAEEVVNSCPGTITGDTSTNVSNLWGNVDTRSAGHYAYVNDGLHVWTDTDAAGSPDPRKVSLGRSIGFPLSNTGVLDIDYTNNGAFPYGPGINLFVTFAPGVTGTLVYEEVYGQDLWLTNGSSQAAKDNAPSHTGGNGSENHGTIDQWLSVYPDAQVTGIAFALGSGVNADGIIHSITVGCTTFYFDYVAPVAAQFNVEPVAPTCTEAGSFNTALFPIVRDGYTLTVNRPFDGPGVYTITATAHEGYFIEGSVSKDVTVLGAIGYQQENNEAPCFNMILPQPEEPTFEDNCGTADDSYTVPADTNEVFYTEEWSEDNWTVTITAHLEYFEDVWEEGVTTEWTYTFTDEDCPLPPTCADLTFDEAQALLVEFPELDGDGDGVACESSTPTPPVQALPATGGSDPLPLTLGAFGVMLLGALVVSGAAIRRRHNQS